MPIEMPRGLPFSVDTWTPNSSRKRHHFLTHAHRDHLQGLAANSSYPIYATRLTRILTVRHLPQIEEELFIDIEVGETVLVRDPDGDFFVTAFDANHCPGAVMFLFEGSFGNLLHTGDCRLSPDCLQKLPLKYIAKKGSERCLDYLFLDCTFGRTTLDMPSKESAIQQVINCIWKHPNAPVVYLACDLLGQEDILVEVSRTFGSKIYVDKTQCAECFQALLLIAPETLSEDASSRFQVFEGFPRLVERASAKLGEARANFQPEPLFIRPSAQWYACDDCLGTQRQRVSLSEVVRDEFGVWHVCYSMHSSQQELEWALQLLRPKWAISTTPSCRAMDLKYVKDHCFKTQLNTDDPIWRLFGVGAEKSVPLPISLVSEVAASSISSSIVEDRTTSCEGCKQLEVKKGSQLWDMPPPTIERPLTLFGRARLGPRGPTTSSDGKVAISAISDMETSSASSIQGVVEGEIVHLQEATVSVQGSSLQGDNVSDLQVGKSVISAVANMEASSASSIQGSVMEGEVARMQEATISLQVSSLQGDDVSDLRVGKSEGGELEVKQGASYIGSSSVYNDDLRKLYRSMNVPVPRPLPSLVQLMEMSKRPKIGF